MHARGIAAYSNSVLSRICLLQAQDESQGPAGFDHRDGERDSRGRSDQPARAGEPRRRLQGEGRQGQGDRGQPSHLASRPDQPVDRAEHRRGPRAVGRAGQGAPDSRHAAQGESVGSADDPHEVAAAAQGRPVQECAGDRRRADEGRHGGGEPRFLQPSDRRGAERQQRRQGPGMGVEGGREIPERRELPDCCSRRAIASRANCSRRSRLRAARRRSSRRTATPGCSPS